MELIIGIILIVVVIALYFITYVVNEKTDVPEGCKDLTDLSHCHNCTNATCGMKQRLGNEKHDQ